MANESKKAWAWLWLSVIVIIIDQWTKYLALHNLIYGVPLPILPFLNFTLSFNPGAAFSFLGHAGGWQVYLFSVISAVIAIVFVVWLGRTSSTLRLRAAGISLIIGGALGNFIDRVRLTYVIDFIDFHIKSWHYATFNIADSAVCVGAFCLILSMLLASSQEKK